MSPDSQTELFPLSVGGGGAHHDGSSPYVSRPYPSIGDELTLRVRVDPELGAREVFVRSTLDGDQRFSRCVEVDRGGAGDTWWEASVTMTNQCMNYRFLIQTHEAVSLSIPSACTTAR